MGQDASKWVKIGLFFVLKLDFENLGPNEKHFLKEVFGSEAWKWEK